MSDITTGTIYKIICRLDHKFCYIGSTFDTLRNRWQRHKSHYRKWLSDPESVRRPCTCYPYFKQYGIENFIMIEIKSYAIHLKDRFCLEAYETLWVSKTRGCNVNPPTSFLNLRKEKQRHYQQANRIKISNKQKQYYQNNRDSIVQKAKQYNQDHRDCIAEYKKNYYHTHKTEISEKAQARVTCDCGATVRRADLSRHYKTEKHRVYLATQTE